MFTEIYCDGFAMNTGPVGTPSPIDELQSIRPDECGVIRCHLRGCLSKDNAGKVWPNHISGALQLLRAEIGAGYHKGPMNYCGASDWFLRTFNRMIAEGFYTRRAS